MRRAPVSHGICEMVAVNVKLRWEEEIYPAKHPREGDAQSREREGRMCEEEAVSGS